MISVIIPIYNAGKYLQECLLSVRKQSYSEIEVICVDDGSTDNSYAIAECFVKEDYRFKLYRQTNAGVSAARNLALSKANGEYVCFIDADDVIASDFIENLINLSVNGEFAICSYTRKLSCLGVGNVQVKHYSAKEYLKHIFDESVEDPNIWMMLFKNSIIQMQHLDFTVGCIRNEDTEFYVKYMANVENVVVSNYKGYFYRLNPSSCMCSKMDVRSFTGIEAQARMAQYLNDRGIIKNKDRILGASVQEYTYATAKEKNFELYNFMHERYDVKYYMTCILKTHPRFLRKCLALCYLLLGKRLFYWFISINSSLIFSGPRRPWSK